MAEQRMPAYRIIRVFVSPEIRATCSDEAIWNMVPPIESIVIPKCSIEINGSFEADQIRVEATEHDGQTTYWQRTASEWVRW